jgi:hypothetical protein
VGSGIVLTGTLTLDNFQTYNVLFSQHKQRFTPQGWFIDFDSSTLQENNFLQ